MVSVSFKNADFPDGITFDLGGFAVPNGGSVELDKDQELAFYARHGKSVKDHFKGNDQVEVSGSTELTPKDKSAYPGDDETSTEVIIEEGEVDPTVPEVDPDTGEVKEDEG